MATLTTIPVAEYLKTFYRPDRDYVDGEVRERNLGEKPHGVLQLFFGSLFTVNRKQWSLRAITEQRVQVSETRYRIPDVCVIRLPSAQENILHEAPLLCIEILSPADSLTDMQDRVDDYVAMGVENIWLVDPVRRRFWTADANGIHRLQAEAFTIPDTQVQVIIADIHAELDAIAAGM